jgi:hypothetical protein
VLLRGTAAGESPAGLCSDHMKSQLDDIPWSFRCAGASAACAIAMAWACHTADPESWRLGPLEKSVLNALLSFCLIGYHILLTPYDLKDGNWLKVSLVFCMVMWYFRTSLNVSRMRWSEASFDEMIRTVTAIIIWLLLSMLTMLSLQGSNSSWRILRAGTATIGALASLLNYSLQVNDARNLGYFYAQVPCLLMFLLGVCSTLSRREQMHTWFSTFSGNRPMRCPPVETPQRLARRRVALPSFSKRTGLTSDEIVWLAWLAYVCFAGAFMARQLRKP